MSMNWDNATKRYGVACFTTEEPADPDGDGDAAQFFDDKEDAEAWIKKAIRAGRFKYFVLYDWAHSGDWDYVDDFVTPKKRKR